MIITLLPNARYKVQINEETTVALYDEPMLLLKDNLIILSPYFTEGEFRVFEVSRELREFFIVDKSANEHA